MREHLIGPVSWCPIFSDSTARTSVSLSLSLPQRLPSKVKRRETGREKRKNGKFGNFHLSSQGLLALFLFLCPSSVRFLFTSPHFPEASAGGRERKFHAPSVRAIRIFFIVQGIGRCCSVTIPIKTTFLKRFKTFTISVPERSLLSIPSLAPSLTP